MAHIYSGWSCPRCCSWERSSALTTWAGTNNLNRRRKMSMVSTQQALMLAAVLFALGVVGLLVRRNLLFILMSIEIMLNAAGLAFVTAGARWGQADGQV